MFYIIWKHDDEVAELLAAMIRDAGLTGAGVAITVRAAALPAGAEFAHTVDQPRSCPCGVPACSS